MAGWWWRLKLPVWPAARRPGFAIPRLAVPWPLRAAPPWTRFVVWGAFVALIGMWLFGMGWGMIVAVAVDMVPELGKVLRVVTRPMYLVSGVVHPVAQLADVLNHHADTVGVAFGQVSAGEI